MLWNSNLLTLEPPINLCSDQLDDGAFVSKKVGHMLLNSNTVCMVFISTISFTNGYLFTQWIPNGKGPI